jgi:penicillin-binding protein 2
VTRSPRVGSSEVSEAVDLDLDALIKSTRHPYVAGQARSLGPRRVRDGLHQAVASEGGTSYDVFKGWNEKQYPVFGKTGTAEGGVNPDQAWYACWVMDKNRPIVVVVTIERGGFGAETAAPAARLILSQWFHTGDQTFHAGTNQTN